MKIIKSIYLPIISLLLLIACDQTNSVGIQIQPQEDQIIVAYDTFHINSTNYYPEAISAQSDTMILGEFYSAKYGSTKAELLIQLAPPVGYKFPDEAKHPTPDSLVLTMLYKTWFGSAYSPIELSIYEINKKSIDYYTQYLSNLIPGDYCDSSILMGKRIATSIDCTSGTPDTNTTKYIRYKFDDTQLNRFFNLPHEAYESEKKFLETFKGLYITSRYGNSTLFHFNEIGLYLYYHYTIEKNGQDTIIKTSIAFPANKEVRQLNRFYHHDIQNIATCHDSINYIKSAGGIYPKISLPLGRIKERIFDKIGENRKFNINAAEIMVEGIEFDDKDVFLDPPTYLLALSKDEYDHFIATNQIPQQTDTTAIVAEYNYTSNSYKIDINYLLTRHLRQEIDKDATLDLLLIPVELTMSSSSTISRIKPLTKLAAITIRSGKNEYSPMRLEILYNGF